MDPADLGGGPWSNRQLPLFTRDELLEVVRLQGEALRDLATVNRELAQNVADHWRRNGKRHHKRHKAPKPTPAEKTPHVPSVPEWQTWRGFVLDLQKLETEWRRDNTGYLPKHAVAAAKGCDVKTITRAQVYHGLKPDDWPPLCWDPAHPPASKADTSGHV